MLKGLLAAGTASAALAAAEEAPAQTPPMPVSDVETAERVAGLKYEAAQREQMARVLPRNRARLLAARSVDLGQTEPALLFDPILPGTPLPTGSNRCRLSSGPTPRYSGNPNDLAFASVADLSRLLKARKVTSSALTRMYLARLKRFDPKLHCAVTLLEERALAQAAKADREIAAGHYRGPLHGIPWGAKDLLGVAGAPTTMGVSPYKTHTLEDATVVKRLDEAGAVLLAKLSLGELAMGDVWFGGKTRNPWNTEEGSSGSSAGPGSAVAAGLVGFGIGSETLGSIVSPSVVNGVTGLRPTFGRVSRHNAMALCWSMDKLGPMCRAVEDCALVLHAIHGPDGQDATVRDVPFRWDARTPLKDLRIGIDADAFKLRPEESAAQKVYAAALEAIHGLGIDPRPIKLPPFRPEYNAMSMIISVEGAAAFQQLNLTGKLAELVQQEDGSWPNTFRSASLIPAADYIQAQRIRRRLQHEMADALKDVDVFITRPFAGQTLFYTNLTGHPTLATRCGMLEGKPKSIEFVGNVYREDAILRLAHAFERATPWHKEWPKLA